MNFVKTLRLKPVFRGSLLKRNLFINTETTPNPHSLKFIPGIEVLPPQHGTGMHFQAGDAKEIKKSPLAKAILANDGVKSVFLGRDFITVTKENEKNWPPLKPFIYSTILDFFAENSPHKDVIVEKTEVSDTTILESDDEVVAAIKELIETRVRPSVQEDGGDIFYVGFDTDTGIVSVRLAGSCVGCPSSSVTLRNGVENMLMHYIPEVKGIQEAPGEGECATDKETKLQFQPGFDPNN